MNYYEIRDNIKSGDILLCSGKSMISKWIRYLTDSEYSHVALLQVVYDRVMVIEAFDYGVRMIPLSLYINNYEYSGKSYNGELSIFRCNDVNNTNIDSILSHAYSKLGTPYGWTDISSIVSNMVFNSDLKPDNDKQIICSEFVQDCFRNANIIMDTENSKYTYPCDFAKDSKFTIIDKINI